MSVFMSDNIKSPDLDVVWAETPRHRHGARVFCGALVFLHSAARDLQLINASYCIPIAPALAVVYVYLRLKRSAGNVSRQPEEPGAFPLFTGSTERGERGERASSEERGRRLLIDPVGVVD
ncbi:hypothetical protein EYF80_040284 [Liparis tanakae]|uniref:Uncharacterized protein n=1 Tax=Liparis tanakae TaxID=230148 RepID=A0A4Z2G9L0_9TELE|nr:hypothetical protein EYF80_040284 [Liparis tanakae]